MKSLALSDDDQKAVGSFSKGLIVDFKQKGILLGTLANAFLLHCLKTRATKAPSQRAMRSPPAAMARI